MSKLSLFLKKNKKQRENVKYVATKSLCDENGNPLEWTIKPLTTAESEDIRESCTREIQVTGKPNVYRNKFDDRKYIAKLIASSVVEPNLYDKELQDSYGVMTPEELIVQMIDNPNEYNAFAEFITNNIENNNINEVIEEAKN